MKNKKLHIKAISIVLALAMLIACIPMTASADTSKIRFGVISDIHYLAPSLKGEGAEWYDWVNQKHKEYNDLDGLIDNALDGILRNAVENGENYVLIPGDMTKDGELESHKALAERLERFEAETGIPVLVIPGNHDINNSNATDYSGDEKVPAATTSPEQFREIYKNLGYDMADSFFVPESGKKGGMLSYACTLGGYRLIAIDSCMYSEDNGAEGNEHMTDGQLADGLLEWIVDECDNAKDNGLTVIGMQHHNLIPHTDIEEATFWPFVVIDWMRIAETYADAGMHYVFTGHLHSNDTVSHVNDNGETVYDILTPTLTGYPNYYKIIDFTSDGETTSMDMQTLDIDKYQPVIADDGTAYEVPFKYAYSFGQTFGDGGVKELVAGLVYPFISDLFAEIKATGGIGEYLKTKNLDLEKIIVDALGTNGLAIGSVEILTVSSNVMGFINDLFAQIDEIYINDADGTIAKVDAIIDKLLSFEVSSLEATIPNEYTGYELTGKGCTLADYATSLLILHYIGDEDISDYPYMNDALERFESGELAEKFFALLLEVVVDDLVQGEILANLKFNPGELFPEGSAFGIFGKIIQGGLEALLGGDNSFINLVSSVLAIPLVPEEYSSVNAIIEHLMGEYITQSQYEAWGYTISWMARAFLEDDGVEDNNCTITYSGPVEVEATQDNYRLPSHIALSLGEDSSSEISITWLTKYSVTGTDIEIIPYSENPVFTGKPSVSGVAAKCESVDKTYYGADLGILGLLGFTRDYNKHTLTVSGLESGTKYSYRIGDAKKGWWSEAGTITTAEGGDEAFTFFYMTDPQAQRKDHYEKFGEVVETAQALYPDARFIVSAGDQVDEESNVKHWNYFLNSTDALLELPFMPTTGNHEKAGAAITENFELPNIPEQNLESGVYYSYDYNDVHFTVLNTNDDDDDKLSQAQIEWMINDISSSDAKWKIVVLHKALYSNGSHYDDSDVEGFRKQLGALLPYLGVDMVLQGHDHVYLRTDVLNANAVVPTRTGTKTYNGIDYVTKYNPKGTIYSICGTSGVKVYHTKDAAATDEKFPRGEAVVDVENSMFSAITVDGDTLYYNAYEVDDGKANAVDTFAIEKTDNKAPVDTFGSGVASFLTKLNLNFMWKIVNFFMNIFGKFMNLIQSI
ncbi:MAG: metallophosphoesterase [Clostridia bacterium]|nr:metallophosphoesterase [Clostridia bacterium]